MCNRKGYQSSDFPKGDAWDRKKVRHKYIRARTLFRSRWSVQQKSLRPDCEEACNRSYGGGNGDFGKCNKLYYE